jgi:hypothetical protein
MDGLDNGPRALPASVSAACNEQWVQDADADADAEEVSVRLLVEADPIAGRGICPGADGKMGGLVLADPTGAPRTIQSIEQPRTQLRRYINTVTNSWGFDSRCTDEAKGPGESRHRRARPGQHNVKEGYIWGWGWGAEAALSYSLITSPSSAPCLAPRAPCRGNLLGSRCLSRHPMRCRREIGGRHGEIFFCCRAGTWGGKGKDQGAPAGQVRRYLPLPTVREGPKTVREAHRVSPYWGKTSISRRSP